MKPIKDLQAEAVENLRIDLLALNRCLNKISEAKTEMDIEYRLRVFASFAHVAAHRADEFHKTARETNTGWVQPQTTLPPPADMFHRLFKKPAKISKLFFPLILLGLFMATGCTQVDRLTGAETRQEKRDHAAEEANKVADFHGVWIGDIPLQGVLTRAYFILVQENDQIIPNAYFALNYGQYGNTAVTGTVVGDTVNLTGHDGVGCDNPWTFSGHLVDANKMVVQIDTLGNYTFGSSCYSLPIHQTVTLSR